MTGIEIVKLLKKHGYKHFKIKGSHYNLQVPHHHKELGKGIENSILKIAGLKG